MRRLLSLSALALAACSQVSATRLRDVDPSVPVHFGAPPPMRGMALGLYGDEPTLPFADALREIRSLGATHVSLVVHWYQTDVSSCDLRARPGHTVRDTTLLAVAHQARALGLGVMVFPILQLDQRS